MSDPGPEPARPAPASAARSGSFWIAWAGYALFYFGLGFQCEALRGDDFGYFRSVLGTLARGRPYTHDWLAPWSAVMTSLCAAAYRLTGNFLLSTWGMLALAALSAFPLLYRLLRARLPAGKAAWLALATLTFPLFFAKAVDFHGFAFTWVLFLSALCLFEAGKIGPFFFVAFLAVANRQNQVALMILPCWRAWEDWRRTRRMPWRIAGYGLGFGLGVLALHFLMNRTYAQEHAVFLPGGFFVRAATSLRAAVAGALVTLGLLSAGNAALGAPGAAWAANLRRPLAPLLGSAALLALACFWPPDLLRTDTPLFGWVQWPQINRAAPWLLLPALWILDYRCLKPTPYLGLVAGFILLACLRGLWWDYYFAEIAALALLIAATGAAPRGGGKTPIILVILFSLNCFYAYLLKIEIDKQRLAVAVCERLERQGRISVEAMTGAPFGYLGWKLFDHFTAHEGRTFGGLSDFIRYVRPNRVTVETTLPWRRGYSHPLGPRAEVLETGRWRVGFFPAEYRVVDGHGDAPAPAGDSSDGLKHAGYRPRPFPLDNAEWKALADSCAREFAAKRPDP